MVRGWSERRATVYLIVGYVVVIVAVLALVLLAVWVANHQFFIENE